VIYVDPACQQGWLERFAFLLSNLHVHLHKPATAAPSLSRQWGGDKGRE
jgi:hypothetical protein